MKRITYLICLMISILLIIAGYSIFIKISSQQGGNNFEKSVQYLNSKGYHIVSGYYPLPTDVLTKDKLQGPVYDKIWRVQSVDAKKYLNKTIESYGFIIKNHPLEKRYSRVSALVMVCENKVIGGYSDSYQPGARGFSPYSIDGKTAEELTDSEHSESEQVWKSSIQKDTNFENAYNYLKGKGYNIVSCSGPLTTYVLTKENLLKAPYMQIWSVQSVDVKNYLDKTIEVYGFTTDNHPLENGKSIVHVVVMVCENNIIGGYSSPEVKRLVGGWVYTIDGKTLKELTGTDYQEWEQQWTEKYK